MDKNKVKILFDNIIMSMNSNWDIDTIKNRSTNRIGEYEFSINNNETLYVYNFIIRKTKSDGMVFDTYEHTMDVKIHKKTRSNGIDSKETLIFDRKYNNSIKKIWNFINAKFSSINLDEYTKDIIKTIDKSTLRDIKINQLI